MMLSGPGSRLTLVLAGVCAALSAVVGWELMTPRRSTAATTVPAHPGGVSLPEIPSWDYRVPPAAKFNESVERPLFIVERRPPEPEKEGGTVTAAASAVQKPQARLLGVVITPQKRQALLQENGSDNVLYLEPGMTLQDWEIKSIEPDRVVLTAGRETEALELRTFEELPGTAAAPPRRAGASAPSPSLYRRDLWRSKRGQGLPKEQ
jgi:hypothetical protein